MKPLTLEFGVLTSGWLLTSAHALTRRRTTVTSEGSGVHLHVVLAEILPVGALKDWKQSFV